VGEEILYLGLIFLVTGILFLCMLLCLCPLFCYDSELSAKEEMNAIENEKLKR